MSHAGLHRLLAGILAAVPLGALGSVAAAIDVTHCGQVIPPGETADLIADLDCPTAPPSGTLQELSAVYLDRGARLRLNGFTLSGNHTGVGCGSRCAVEGPGTIRGHALGIVSYGSTRVAGVVFRENGQTAIYVLGARRLRATDVAILDADGLVAIIAHNLKAERLTIENCWYGISAIKMTGSDITMTGCGQRGFGGGSVRATRLTATDNGGPGIHAERVVLSDSVLTGNDTLGSGVDLRSDRFPRLENTTCGRSERGETGVSFGVCLND
jgi:hypothetical protein